MNIFVRKAENSPFISSHPISDPAFSHVQIQEVFFFFFFFFSLSSLISFLSAFGFNFNIAISLSRRARKL